MNILIVGNGFDLSHYLPTKYDHFMDVMRAIEEKDLGQPIVNVLKNSVDDFPTLLMKVFEIKNAFNGKNYEMSFDELFSKCREKWFINKTKSIYEIHSIQLNFEIILKIKYLLKNNGWYQYFKNHLQEVDTWIDFETKIEDLLVVLAQCITKINLAEVDHNGLSGLAEVVSSKEKKVLSFFDLFNEYSGLSKINGKHVIYPTSLSINAKFCYGKSSENEFNQNEFLRIIQKQLEEFIDLFNLYLELIIDRLEPKSQFKIEAESWVKPDHIFSFNYTNTFQKFYQNNVKTEYLHGKFGEKQNIVLGISDLEDESLKKLKAYGFTKYHQKLFKETDYLFLDKFKKKVEVHKRRIEYFEKDFGYEDPTARKFERQKIMEMESPLDLNIKIWGHSLDVSDKEYILDLFSLNDDIDRKVRVVVYYFDDNAKFSLLNNLLAILKKDKVEKWMKNKWLIFEKNPEIKF